MERAILRTFCYHDIFDYPLTLEEIHRFLIEKKASLKEIQLTINNQPLDSARGKQSTPRLRSGQAISNRDGFYFLKDRQEIVKLRKKREKYSREKLLLAKKVARFLRWVPTIKMVAVTGALAVNNAKKDDDIDFLIITSKNRLWLTRIQAVLLIELLASRPQLEKGRLKDTICLNIFLDENHLRMPKEKQNLFVAHEIVQMKPLWQKDAVYQKFLKENQWVKKFLPNWKN